MTTFNDLRAVTARGRKPFGSRLTDVSHLASLEGVLAEAGLDFRVEKYKVVTEPIITPDGVLPYVTMDKDCGIVAWKNGEPVPFRCLGKDYEVIQYADAFAPLDYLMDEGFITGYEHAGSVDNGQRGFIIAKLADEVALPMDPHYRRILITTSHDGTASLRVSGWLERLHCANQIPAVLRAKGNRIAMIKHTKNAQKNVDALRSSILGAVKMMESLEQELRELEDVRLYGNDADRFITRLFPIHPDMTDRQITAANRKQQDMHFLLNSDTNANIKGTAASLFAAAVEYSDYYSRGNNDARASRILKGGDIPLKARALTLAQSI